MTLATILGVCALLASPPAGGMSVAKPAGFAGIQTQQDSPAANPAQAPATTEPESKPAPTPPPAAGAEPTQQNPPPAQGSTPPNPQSEAPPSPSPAENSAPPGTPPATQTKPAQAQKPSTPAKPASSHRSKAKTAHTAAKTKTVVKTADKTSKLAHKPAAKPGAQAATAATQHTIPKKVVRNGSTGDPAVQLSPGLSQQQSSAQRRNVSQLLSTTDTNLKKLAGREISSSQKETVEQIQQYVQQAKAASDAGDMERAHNLAVKARVLSEELLKH